MRRFFPAALLALSALAIAPAFAAGDDPFKPAVTEDADFSAGRKAIDAQDWKKAISALERASRKYDDEPAVHNWLGFAYRKAGDLDRAFRHYNRALRLDPNHRGAHEYIGEAYLMKKDVENAQKHLRSLERICGKGCEEYQDLERAIAEFKAKGS